MGTFRKIPDRFKTNRKGVKLFLPTSDNVRKKDGLWIPHRKRTYLYWYKFLQICLQKKLSVKGYRGWHVDTILETPFDIWWESHWKELFSTKEKGGTPKFTTTTDRIKLESIRYSYFVCCLSENIMPYKNGKFNPIKREYSNYRIAYHIFKYELMSRYPTRENGLYMYPTDKDFKPDHWTKLDKQGRLVVGQHVSRHKTEYIPKIIKNVRKGMFP